MLKNNNIHFTNLIEIFEINLGLYVYLIEFDC